MTHADEVVALANSQDGDKYIFGAEVSMSDTDPDAFDCSELIQWVCGRLSVSPRMPDGSWYQARHCNNYGKMISVAEAIGTKGALLFRFVPADGWESGSRPSAAHVAISLGDGTTMEARSSRHGVGHFSAYGRGWTQGALIPGVEYKNIPAPPTPDPEEELTAMQIEMPTLKLYDGYVTKDRPHMQPYVRLEQGLLLAAGLPDPNSEDPRTMCDGKRGPGTTGRIKQFQDARGLTVDGITGSQTWAALLNQ